MLGIYKGEIKGENFHISYTRVIIEWKESVRAYTPKGEKGSKYAFIITTSHILIYELYNVHSLIKEMLWEIMSWPNFLFDTTKKKHSLCVVLLSEVYKVFIMTHQHIDTEMFNREATSLIILWVYDEHCRCLSSFYMCIAIHRQKNKIWGVILMTSVKSFTFHYLLLLFVMWILLLYLWFPCSECHK